jgi:ABC-type Fe3+-siderophore transport system permease subunit
MTTETLQSSKIFKGIIIIAALAIMYVNLFVDNIKLQIATISFGAALFLFMYIFFRKSSPASTRNMLIGVGILMVFGVILYFVVNYLVDRN